MVTLKKSQPFVRTMPSTLERVSTVAADLTPKPTVYAVSSHTGGVFGASSAGSQTRNERQVKNTRSKLKAGPMSSTDPLLSVQR